MDAFFASIEQRDRPELRGKPVAVGHGAARGVVAAASYEARKYGVRSAMASVTALKRCPQLIFVPPRFEAYQSVSHQIMEIFAEYTDLIEPMSLDEAFLDVTTDKKEMGSAILTARQIKARIKEETGLTASAGVSFNKFLAKIASDYKKPDGLFAILPQDAASFVERLEVERFFGVGKVTAQKMHQQGIFMGADLKKVSEERLVQLFGKAGHIYYQQARAIDEREVEPHKIRKSVGAENTFEKDIDDSTALTIELYHIAREVMRRMEKAGFWGRTITLKVKFADFETITRSRTLTEPVTTFTPFWQTAKELLKQTGLLHKKVRLLGLSAGNAPDECAPQKNLALPLQLNLF